jgi:hypothetical protein
MLISFIITFIVPLVEGPQNGAEAANATLSVTFGGKSPYFLHFFFLIFGLFLHLFLSRTFFSPFFPIQPNTNHAASQSVPLPIFMRREHFEQCYTHTLMSSSLVPAAR